MLPDPPRRGGGGGEQGSGPRGAAAEAPPHRGGARAGRLMPPSFSLKHTPAFVHRDTLTKPRRGCDSQMASGRAARRATAAATSDTCQKPVLAVSIKPTQQPSHPPGVSLVPARAVVSVVFPHYPLSNQLCERSRRLCVFFCLELWSIWVLQVGGTAASCHSVLDDAGSPMELLLVTGEHLPFSSWSP